MFRATITVLTIAAILTAAMLPLSAAPGQEQTTKMFELLVAGKWAEVIEMVKAEPELAKAQGPLQAPPALRRQGREHGTGRTARRQRCRD